MKNTTTNSIMNFIEAKQTLQYLTDEYKFEDYPIHLIVNGENQVGYIQDVIREHSDNVHTLTVIVTLKSKFIEIVKTCIAPPECKIDWDIVHCTTEISGDIV